MPAPRYRPDGPDRASDRGHSREDRRSHGTSGALKPQHQQEQPHVDHHEQRNASSHQEQRQLSRSHGSPCCWQEQITTALATRPARTRCSAGQTRFVRTAVDC